MYDYINWNITERNKVIRILARDIELLERIDIEKYKFDDPGFKYLISALFNHTLHFSPRLLKI
jgi:hypothetical protein